MNSLPIKIINICPYKLVLVYEIRTSGFYRDGDDLSNIISFSKSKNVLIVCRNR